MTYSSQVAYCGLFCGECIIRQGNIGKLCTDLLRIMKTPEFQKLAAGLPKIKPETYHSLERIDECYSVLEAMTNLDCEHICKEAGGTAGCKIRECCQKKGLDGCWECDLIETCETLAWLNTVNCDANILNLGIIKEKGLEVFLAGDKNW
jgi:hypothetical protein